MTRIVIVIMLGMMLFLHWQVEQLITKVQHIDEYLIQQATEDQNSTAPSATGHL
jgi:hypothetical protein